MVYDLLQPEHKLLRTRMEPLSVEELEKIHQLTLSDLKILLDNNLKAYGGIGISANQIGLPIRAFSMYTDPTKGTTELCYNPTIVEQDDDTTTLSEGCLTYPFLFIELARPKSIKVEYTNQDGDIVSKRITGLTCRVFQHEYDHMEGKLFVDMASKTKMKKAKKQQARILQKEGYQIQRSA